eukprot:TRINITY_DN7122_c0_g1_i1.p1 TRINITY_DN7122_c0_g1~~TRINITY_DN7122_c0_g1_i1.p1  ORF type:complete len:462 (-),score=187.37 TRINITY_DN7122_c0_g1_i1:135-1520(-)
MVDTQNDSIKLFEADLTYFQNQFQQHLQILVDKGIIIEIGKNLQQKYPQVTITSLKNKCLLPGFINSHSHAFQRGLRGKGEIYNERQYGNFWKWRQEMYALVMNLSSNEIYNLTKQSFQEMIECGITTVGEFHYLHHSNSNQQDFALDRSIIQAAKDVGIRLVLLNTFYKTASVDAKMNLSESQQRFYSHSIDHFVNNLSQLEIEIEKNYQMNANDKNSLIQLGIAAHSIRATPLQDLIKLDQLSKLKNYVFHMHLEEQMQEINDCIQFYSKTPISLLLENINLDQNFTAVHCTQTTVQELNQFIQTGANISMCPLTEANLADGIANVSSMIYPSTNQQSLATCITLGTDCNARICLIEEARWLEYVQRLQLKLRGVCSNTAGFVGKVLFDCTTLNGARSLGINAGSIEVGKVADFIAINLNAQVLKGWTEETLFESIIFGSSGTQIVTNTFVGGNCVWSI